MKITVMGSGYVGTTTALLLAKLGHDVIGYDIDRNKVEQLTSGKIPFVEPGLTQLLQEGLRCGNIIFTADSRIAVEQSEILMIAVGTPSTKEGQADLTYIKQVLDVIIDHINDAKIVVTKSTVPVGTNRWMKRHLEQHIDIANFPVEVISNPEFLREGVALHDALHPSRTVIGGENELAIQKVKQMYERLETTYFICNYETAELIKYASNGFLASKISFINEIARLADVVGANIQGVAAGMGMDPRISPHHLHAGIGYGGSCFPKDVEELLHLARQHEIQLHLLYQAKQINDSQIAWFIRKIESYLDLKDKIVLVLGVSFKEDTDDQRYSSGVRLIEQLLERDVAEIRVMDPTVTSSDQIQWSHQPNDLKLKKIKVYTDETEAGTGIHAAVLATSWPSFLTLPWQDWASNAASTYLFDGRNFLDPHLLGRAGWQYVGIARGDD